MYVHGGYFRDDGVTAASFHPALSILTKAPKLHLQHLIKNNDEQNNIIPYVAGYASINYRLSPCPAKSPQDPCNTPTYELRNATWPDQIHDVLAAISHLQLKHGFGQRYLLVGHSVGATMALLSTLASGKTFTSSPDTTLVPKVEPPMAVLSVSGIYDFELLHQSFPDYNEVTENAIRDPKDVTLASPTSYSRAEYGETWAQKSTQKRVLILAHSRDDGMVDWKQVEAIEAVFASGPKTAVQNNFAVQVVEMKGQHNDIWGHGTELARVIRIGLGALRRLDGI